MNLIPAWLATLRARRDKRPPDTDLADMGTTFGLEAAMPGLNDASRQELQRAHTGNVDHAFDRPTRPARL